MFGVWRGGFLEVWELQRQLSSKYKMVYLDLAGHGKSSTARTKFTMRSFGEDVTAVIEKEDLDNVILIGWSMGGPIIQEAAEILGDRVIGLIGVDSFFPYHPLYQEMEESASIQFVDEFKGDTQLKIKKMYDTIYNNQGEKVDKQVQNTLIKGKFPGDDVFISELEELAAFDVRPLLERSTIPIKAVISGLNVPSEDRPSFAEYNIDAVFMEGHGHGLHLSGPDIFHQHLEKMVREIVSINAENTT